MAVNFQNMFFSKNVDMQERLFQKGEDFVNSSQKWMRHYVPSSMQSFSITFSKPEKYYPDVQNLVNFSVDHEAKSLTLNFADPLWMQNEDNFDFHPPTFSLPLHVYNNATHVESLTLFCCKFSASEFKKFTALKHLCLGYMHFGDSTIKDLLSSFPPSLHSLCFKRCRMESFCEITLTHINSLIFDNCIIDSSINFNAPRLKYMMYNGELCPFEFEINKYLFTEAVLDFTPECKYRFNEANGIVLETLFLSLFSVRTLTVCSFVLQLLVCGDDPVRGQELNVRTLKLNTSLHLNEMEGIQYLFNNSPKLERVIMNVCSPRRRIFRNYDGFKFMGFVGCGHVISNLKNIEMNGFTGEMYQLPILKFLLCHGVSLEKVLVRVSKEGNSSLYLSRAQNHLQRFEKGSDDVQVVISQ